MYFGTCSPTNRISGNPLLYRISYKTILDFNFCCNFTLQNLFSNKVQYQFKKTWNKIIRNIKEVFDRNLVFTNLWSQRKRNSFKVPKKVIKMTSSVVFWNIKLKNFGRNRKTLKNHFLSRIRHDTFIQLFTRVEMIFTRKTSYGVLTKTTIKTWVVERCIRRRRHSPRYVQIWALLRLESLGLPLTQNLRDLLSHSSLCRLVTTASDFWFPSVHILLSTSILVRLFKLTNNWN